MPPRDIFSCCYMLDSHLDLSNINRMNVVANNIFHTLKVKSVDISNFKLTRGHDIGLFCGDNPNLTDIGMVHCDIETINIVAAQTPVQPITIWIGTHLTADEIASLDQYDHITYSIQLENAERLLLSSPLLEGDEIKVIDGQLCHVHNMGMVVLDGSTDELGYHSWETTYTPNNPRFYVILPNNAILSVHDQHGYESYANTATCSRFKGIWNDIDVPHFKTCYSTSLGNAIVWFYVPKEETVGLSVRQWMAKNLVTIIYQLAEPWTEVIDLPRANIDVELYENGVLYMSDPTASTNRVDSDGNMIIDAVQGDSVVNVANQQFPIELSEENNNPIQTGEILEDNSIRPKFYGRTIVNLMDRINWSKYIEETKAGYSYDSTDITAKYITITNFNDKPIYVQIKNIADNTVVNSQLIAVNETVNININETSYLAGIYGLVADGWNGINIHEITNVNIFEGELSEDELPENRMSGMRNAFDKYQTSEGKYRVEMVVSNSPIQFGKAGRK